MNHDLSDSGGSSVAEAILPSRRAALKALQGAIEVGPVLITGGPGVGKTWLAARLIERVAESWFWVSIDLYPLAGPDTLIRVIAREMGLASRPDPREALARNLTERRADGVRCGLVVDEAHLASARVLEDLRILSNDPGRTDRFAGLVLVGQTCLAHRLNTCSLAALSSRLAARIHLRPLDFDESSWLLERGDPALVSDRRRLDRLHHELGGNPRQLLRLRALVHDLDSTATRDSRVYAVTTPTNPPGEPPTVPVEALRDELDETLHIAADDPWAGLGTSRPPLRIEENLIEVGWEPEPEAAELDSGTPAPLSSKESEPIQDHYAALQAWKEWTSNQGRQGITDAPARPDVATPDSGTDPLSEEISVRRTPVSTGRENTWLETPHSFAPYSQLFSQVRQANDSES